MWFVLRTHLISSSTSLAQSTFATDARSVEQNPELVSLNCHVMKAVEFHAHDVVADLRSELLEEDTSEEE